MRALIIYLSHPSDHRGKGRPRPRGVSGGGCEKLARGLHGPGGAAGRMQGPCQAAGIGDGAGQLHSVTICYKKLVVVFPGRGIMMVRVRYR